jgi:hypothetical protein
MDFPCGNKWKLHYSGSAIKKQEGGLPDLRILTQRSAATTKGKPMLRAILTATALLCISQAAFAQELTAEQRSACMGDYEKYCKGVTPGGGRIIACLAKESDKITPACKKVLAAAEKK